jgi:hypothetical protein
VDYNSVAGFISGKELFTHACRELYYFQHVFRLHKFMAELTRHRGEVSASHQAHNTLLVSSYLRASIRYDVNIPHLYFQCICRILMQLELKYAEDVEMIMPIKDQRFKDSIQVRRPLFSQ